MSKLRWKKHPIETGLRSVGLKSNKRPSNLHDGTTEYATVYAHDYSWIGKRTGWYWVAFEGVPYHNTSAEQSLTEQEAKDQAKAYVLKHLTTRQKEAA